MSSNLSIKTSELYFECACLSRVLVRVFWSRDALIAGGDYFVGFSTLRVF